jgi:hypothetical protein
MHAIRALTVLMLILLLPHKAWSDEVADFRKALADLQPGVRYTPKEYLACTGDEEVCQRLEGAIGKVRVQVELKEGIIAGFHIVAEGVRIEQELLPTLRGQYGPDEKKWVGLREESVRHDQALTIAAAGYVTYEWRHDGTRIILFSQDPFRLVYDDGRVEVTEPRKTYVSGELAPGR